MTIARLNAKGGLIIPFRIRRQAGLKPGGRVEVRIEKSRVVLDPLPDDPVAALRGMCRGFRGSPADDLLKERARERLRKAGR